MSTKRRTRGAALIVALASTVIVVGNAHAQDDGTNSEGDPSAEQASQAELDAAADAADGDGDGPGDAADSAPPDDGSNLNPDVDRSSIDIAVAAAAANDELEQAARDSMDVPLGDPIIPQRDPDRPHDPPRC